MASRPANRNGLCTFYADESDDQFIYAIATVAIPTLVRRFLSYQIEWDDYLDKAKAWRRDLNANFGIRARKELKGSKLATGHNSYGPNGTRIYGQAALDAYRFALSSLTFLPPGSLFSVYALRGASLYGHRKLEAALYAMFQRMQKHCDGWKVDALIFFDEGHNEYRTLFRRAKVHLPTGSKFGGWAGGKPSKSLPFSAALKDVNFKDSKYSHFIQIADLVAYATVVKARAESGRLSAREINFGWGSIHDAIPRSVVNQNVSPRRDGIVAILAK